MINTKQALLVQIRSIEDYARDPSSGLSLAELREIEHELHIATIRIRALTWRAAEHPSTEGMFG